MYSRKYYTTPENSSPMEIKEILIKRKFTFDSEEREYMALEIDDGSVYLSQRGYTFPLNKINTDKNRRLILILAKCYFNDSQFEKMCESVSEHF